jgi:beta-lactamase regulating signal transducer with metallopeptidase domain
MEKAKFHEKGSKGCNFHKGYELSCCPGAGTVVENPDTDTTITPSISIASISPTISTSSEMSFAPTSSATPTTKLYMVEVIAAIVGSVTGLVGAAFAFALWKQNQHQHQQQQ